MSDSIAPTFVYVLVPVNGGMYQPRCLGAPAGMPFPFASAMSAVHQQPTSALPHHMTEATAAAAATATPPPSEDGSESEYMYGSEAMSDAAVPAAQPLSDHDEQEQRHEVEVVVHAADAADNAEQQTSTACDAAPIVPDAASPVADEEEDGEEDAASSSSAPARRRPGRKNLEPSPMEEFLMKSPSNLDEVLNTSSLTQAEVIALKQVRRRLKNRMYARASRARAQARAVAVQQAEGIEPGTTAATITAALEQKMSGVDLLMLFANSKKPTTAA